MKISLDTGTYVLAVSGGIDSMVLLDILSKQPGLQLIVAHYDHGMRVDASLDRELVQSIVKAYDMPFVYDNGQLGPDASEAQARAARYKFFNTVASVVQADAIITAHHQDDLIETAIINILRGTGRRGLTSLKSSKKLLRPLLGYSKADITNYAIDNHLVWREDSTNSDTKYLRNYVRYNILTKFSDKDKIQFLRHIDDIKELNQVIDKCLKEHLAIHPAINKLDRHWFIMLPHSVAREVLVDWFRNHQVQNIDKKLVEHVLRDAKTLSVGKQISINKQIRLKISQDYLALDMHER